MIVAETLKAGMNPSPTPTSPSTAQAVHCAIDACRSSSSAVSSAKAASCRSAAASSWTSVAVTLACRSTALLATWPTAQMALGFFNHLANDQGVAWSGGSEPGDEINPAAIAAMAEVGIDITREFPKPWTDEILRAADVVVTMGCGDACPFFPGKRYENWELPDPAGQSVDAVRPIRDDIEERVRRLLDDLGITLVD